MNKLIKISFLSLLIISCNQENTNNNNFIKAHKLKGQFSVFNTGYFANCEAQVDLFNFINDSEFVYHHFCVNNNKSSIHPVYLKGKYYLSKDSSIILEAKILKNYSLKKLSDSLIQFKQLSGKYGTVTALLKLDTKIYKYK